jgi:hypothetical protein
MKMFACLLASMFCLVLPSAALAQETTNPTPDDMTAQARALVDALAKGDFAGASKNFDERMRAALPPEKLQLVWENINTQAGDFKRQTTVRTEKVGQYDAVIVTCEFAFMALDTRVVFNDKRQVTGLFFVPASKPSSANAYTTPSYVRPASFQEKEVTVGTGEWAVPGTLAMPVLPTGTTARRATFPAVVLVHGSGPHDRDETVGAFKPFRDLAQGLASQGIAVLRYEKRTKAHGEKIMKTASATFTVKEEVIDDALAAVALLRKMEGINPRRIFVLGHSLGGMLAPRIARADPHIAGLILLAGASRPLEDVLLPQFTYLFSLDGVVSPEEQAQLDALIKQLAKLKDPQTNDATLAAELPLQLPARYWLALRGYMPAQDARTLKTPMLILQGERDYQVTMEDFEGWKILSSRKNVQLKSYPRLNHLFIEGEGKSTPEEYSKTGNIPPYVIDDITAWINKMKN